MKKTSITREKKRKIIKKMAVGWDRTGLCKERKKRKKASYIYIYSISIYTSNIEKKERTLL